MCKRLPVLGDLAMWCAGEGSDADVESLGFSLHIAQVIGELRGKAAIMQSMADAEAAELQRRQDGDPVDVDEDESATTTSGGVASLVRGGRRRGKEQAGAAAEKAARAQAQAALEKRCGMPTLPAFVRLALKRSRTSAECLLLCCANRGACPCSIWRYWVRAQLAAR